MIYLLLGSYLLSLVIIYDGVNYRKGRNFNFLLAYILMVALIAFRYRVGGDTLNYIAHFENTTPQLYALRLFATEKTQPIPAIIFSLCKTFFDDFTYVQAIFAIFVNAVVFYFFKQNTRYVFTAIFLYALTFYMRLNCEIMRESLAIAFFLLGYPYMMNQKYIKYYIYAFFAFMCHSSAVFIFTLPLFLSLKSRQKVFLVLLLFILIMALLINNATIMKIMEYYLDFFADYQSTGFGKIGIVLSHIIIPFFFLSEYKRYVSPFTRFGIYAYIGCGVVSLFFYILYRFNNYLMPIYILLVADYLNTLRYRRGLSFPNFRLIVMSFVFLYTFTSPYFRDVTRSVGRPARWYCCWYPYYSIFDKQEDFDREYFIANQND